MSPRTSASNRATGRDQARGPQGRGREDSVENYKTVESICTEDGRLCVNQAAELQTTELTPASSSCKGFTKVCELRHRTSGKVKKLYKGKMQPSMVPPGERRNQAPEEEFSKCAPRPAASRTSRNVAERPILGPHLRPMEWGLSSFVVS